MASKDSNTSPAAFDQKLALEELMNANSAVFAIKHLARMLAESEQDDGFESVDHAHRAAMYIAIQQLSDSLMSGVLDFEYLEEKLEH